ncbi:hypothetical protein BJ170DRAFT_169720 [Xylariales sp. AK1849]|nr:hypothetical protein BJ170DRAFT_169720 [Xylariales sp. AK1849]
MRKWHGMLVALTVSVWSADSCTTIHIFLIQIFSLLHPSKLINCECIVIDDYVCHSLVLRTRSSSRVFYLRRGGTKTPGRTTLPCRLLSYLHLPLQLCLGRPPASNRVKSPRELFAS